MSKTDDIKRDSNKIWLAGLGAYSLVEDQGSEAFEELVSKGRIFENLNHTKEIEVAPETRLDELKVRANQTMDRIERAFDMRVSSTLSRLGISRKSDLEGLYAKIDRLEVALEKIAQELQKDE